MRIYVEWCSRNPFSVSISCVRIQSALLEQTVIHHFWILRPINWTHASGSNRHISPNLLLNRLCWVCGCALTNCALARLQRAHDPKRETEAPEPIWGGGRGSTMGSVTCCPSPIASARQTANHGSSPRRRRAPRERTASPAVAGIGQREWWMRTQSPDW